MNLLHVSLILLGYFIWACCIGEGSISSPFRIWDPFKAGRWRGFENLLIESADKSFFYVKCHCHNDITKGSVAVTWTARRDKLLGVLSLSWKVFFESYKLLFLWYHFNINEQDFFNLMRDQNIQNKKNYDATLCICKQLPFHFYVYFWKISRRRKTLGCYVEWTPPILYVCMVPWKYFFSTKTKKEVTKLKEGCFHKGRFPYSCNLPRLWNTASNSCPWMLRRLH